MSELSAQPATTPEPAGPSDADRPDRPSFRERWVPSLVQAAIVVVVLAAAGALGGWLWHHLYDVPQGVAIRRQWIGLDETDYRDLFGGTALYALIAGVGGLVLGVLLAVLLDRDELLTLAALVVGALLAAWIMTMLGEHLGNPDPDVVARTAKDGTKIPGDLTLGSPAVGLLWPAAASLGAMLVFFFLPRRRRG